MRLACHTHAKRQSAHAEMQEHACADACRILMRSFCISLTVWSSIFSGSSTELTAPIYIYRITGKSINTNSVPCDYIVSSMFSGSSTELTAPDRTGPQEVNRDSSGITACNQLRLSVALLFLLHCLYCCGLCR